MGSYTFLALLIVLFYLTVPSEQRSLQEGESYEEFMHSLLGGGGPFCQPKCLNNGKCVARQTCECPKEFTGRLCQFEYKRECLTFQEEDDYCNSFEKSKYEQCDEACLYDTKNNLSELNPQAKKLPSSTEIPYTTKREVEIHRTTHRSAMYDICPREPPLSKYAKHNRLDIMGNIKYKIECFSGHYFSDGSKVKILDCEPSIQRWTHNNEEYLGDDCEFPNAEKVADNEVEIHRTTHRSAMSNICRDPPYSKYANNNRLGNMKYKIECFPGHYFSDGSKVKILDCEPSIQKWTYNNEEYLGDDCEFSNGEKDVDNEVEATTGPTSSGKKSSNKYESYEEYLQRQEAEAAGPSCSPRCDNDGKCVAKNTCECPEKFSGNFCQFSYTRDCLTMREETDLCYGTRIPGYSCDHYCWAETTRLEEKAKALRKDASSSDTTTELYDNENTEENVEEITEGPKDCPFEPPNSENVFHIRTVRNDEIIYKVECLPGYVFPDGSKTTELWCSGDKKWYHKETGSDRAPNCTPEDDGITTQKPGELNGCSYQAPVTNNAVHVLSINRSPREYEVQCLPGYQFSDGSNFKYLVCEESAWVPKDKKLSEMPDCEEISCPAGQKYAHNYDGCSKTCGDLAKQATCKKFMTSGCRCPEGEYLDDNKCVPAEECPCSFEDTPFSAGYKQVMPGEKYLEICTCQVGVWNCSAATKLDQQKHPSHYDLETLCERDGVSCKILRKPKKISDDEDKSADLSSPSEFQKIDGDKKRSSNVFELIRYALGLSKQGKPNSEDAEIVSNLEEREDIPGVKVISLNLQSVEIQGRHGKNSENSSE